MVPLDRRRQILDAAERLFGHYGPSKTTIGDIAREAGIGVGSVYLEFASKDAIVAELAGARRQRIAVAMRTAARTGDHGSRLAAALESRVRALFELAAAGAHACDVITCSASKPPPLNAGALGRFAEEERQVLCALIQAGVDDGDFASSDAARTTLVIERAYAVLSPPWVFSITADEALEMARDLNRLLIEGLRSRSEAASAPRAARRRKRSTGR